MLHKPQIPMMVHLLTLTSLVACSTDFSATSDLAADVAQARMLLVPSFRVGSQGPAPCVVASDKPALWLPLDSADDTGLTEEIVSEAYGTVFPANHLPTFVPGLVGNTIILNGSNYIEVRDMDQVDPNLTGFSFGLWVMPAEVQEATLISHAPRFAPGSWRLLTTTRKGIRFEFCDEGGCHSHELEGSLPTGRWSYISGIMNVVLVDSHLRTLNITLQSSNSDDVISSFKTLPLPSHFDFNVKGSMVVGASLDVLPTDVEPEGPHLVTTPVDLFMGAIDELMYYNTPVDEEVLTNNAGASAGLCQACIHDVIPPEIDCPAPISIQEGQAIRPIEISAVDSCDSNPTIVTTVSHPSPGKRGDVVDVTYTAIDDAGNQSSCATQIDIIDPLEANDPSNRAILQGGSCTLTAPSNVVISGSPLTLNLSATAFQCSNGTCDVVREFSHPVPGAYVGMAPIAMSSNTLALNISQYGANISSSTSSIASISYDLLQPVANSYTFTYRVYDHTSRQPVGQFSCSTSVLIQPVVSSYCGQPISWWNTQRVTGRIHYYNLNDPNVYSGQGWFNGSRGDDLIIGTPAHDKARGQDGSDCLWGGAGQDTLEGNAGADHLEGSADMDHLRGGSGNDTLWGNEGADKLFGEGEADWIYGGPGGDTIEGQSGGDRLYGDAGNDDIYGGDGVDLIYGGDHNDVIEGQAEADTIFGGRGCDDIQGNAGGDDLLGESGSDHVWGGDGPDEIMGGTERDFLVGNGGDDNLMGEEGDDWMCGSAKSDDLDGGSGTDECRQNGGMGWMQCEENNGASCTSDFTMTAGWPCN